MCNDKISQTERLRERTDRLVKRPKTKVKVNAAKFTGADLGDRPQWHAAHPTRSWLESAASDGCCRRPTDLAPRCDHWCYQSSTDCCESSQMRDRRSVHFRQPTPTVCRRQRPEFSYTTQNKLQNIITVGSIARWSGRRPLAGGLSLWMSAMGQPTRPTQPSIPQGSVNK